MFVLPIHHNHSWATHFFDFQRRRTTILDPMMSNGDKPMDELQEEHGRLADELLAAIIKCIDAYFDGWKPKTAGWYNWFPRNVIGPWVCKRESSGIFALHFARQWMGTKMQRELSSIGGDIDNTRMILLFEVLGMKDNPIQLPKPFDRCQKE
ncbi:hypothetical protein VPH35_020430 [Triticum aestivum]